MRPWVRRTIRGLAIVNVLLATFGLYFLATTVLCEYALPPDPRGPAYYPQAFYGRTIINLVFLIALLVGGTFLWRLERRGLSICNIVFGGEIIYFCLDIAFGFFSMFAGGKVRLLGLSMGAAAGTGDMGISAQILTGYPIIALVGLNIAYRKLHPVKS